MSSNDTITLAFAPNPEGHENSSVELSLQRAVNSNFPGREGIRTARNSPTTTSLKSPNTSETGSEESALSEGTNMDSFRERFWILPEGEQRVPPFVKAEVP